MNVTILAESLMFGGVNRYCLNLAEGLGAYPDVQVSLLALPDQSADWLRHEADVRGMHIQVLPMRSTFDVRVVQQLRSWLVEQRVDILHSQGYRSNMISRLAVRVGWLPLKLLCTVHGAYHFPTAPLQSRLYYGLDYLTMQTSDRIIAVSRATLAQLARWGLKRQTQVIHNGTAIPALVDPQTQRRSRVMLGLPPDAKIVLFVGRFNPQKGISTLLEVARRTLAERDGVIFLLVGDGELMPDAKMCAQTFGARMILAGQHRDVSRFYAAADLLFLPSRTEGLPMALIEAFAWGVPAIASNVGGIPEVVVDGVNGFLCDPMNSAHMCERLLQILSNDALRQSFGAHARSTAEANFSLERMSLETYRVYQQLCQGGRVATVD